MRMSFHRIAYEALHVCNPVAMATIDDRVRATGLTASARALDIGCGNASVSIRLASGFGLRVDAVELAPAMADLARSRIAAANAGVALHEARSAEVLTAHPPWDLIIALGVTEPVGDGIRDPQGMFEGLKPCLRPGGWLLWGDLVWMSEPAPPLRQLVEATNTYADHEGWQAAARAAGFEVVSGEISPPHTWSHYTQTMQDAVARWLAANPDHPDAPSVASAAHRIRLMFDFGDGALGFGLYLLRRPG